MSGMVYTPTTTQAPRALEKAPSLPIEARGARGNPVACVRANRVGRRRPDGPKYVSPRGTSEASRVRSRRLRGAAAGTGRARAGSGPAGVDRERANARSIGRWSVDGGKSSLDRVAPAATPRLPRGYSERADGFASRRSRGRLRGPSTGQEEHPGSLGARGDAAAATLIFRAQVAPIERTIAGAVDGGRASGRAVDTKRAASAGPEHLRLRRAVIPDGRAHGRRVRAARVGHHLLPRALGARPCQSAK